MTNPAIDNAVDRDIYTRIEFLPGLPGGLPAIRFKGTAIGFDLNEAGEIVTVGASNITGSGGGTIGGAIGNSPIDNAVLFIDADGKLAQDAGLTYTNANGVIVGDSALIAAAAQLYSTGVYAQDADGNKANLDATSFLTLTGWTVRPYALFDSSHLGLGRLSLDIDANGGLAVHNDSGATIALFSQDQSVTLPHLAGVGPRPVVADANGKLSA